MAKLDTSSSPYSVLPQDIFAVKDSKDETIQNARVNIIKLHKSVYKVDLRKETNPENFYGKKSKKFFGVL